MSEDTKVFSLEDALLAQDTSYASVPYGKGLMRIGSLSSADIIEWMEDNDVPEKRREAGLNLIVKSLVGPEPENLRVPKERREEFLAAFRGKDARANGRLVKAVLELNGLDKAARESVKNDSSEADSGASPSVSLPQ